jgi:hypothetical protein
MEARTSVATWLKAAEDGDELILRLLELEGQPDTVVLPESGYAHPLGPFGIATLRRAEDGHWAASDGLES